MIPPGGPFQPRTDVIAGFKVRIPADCAQALGYVGFIVANNVGDGLITMSAGTDDVITIPGYFVGPSTGEVIKAAEGGDMHAEVIFDG